MSKEPMSTSFLAVASFVFGANTGAEHKFTSSGLGSAPSTNHFKKNTSSTEVLDVLRHCEFSSSKVREPEFDVRA